MKRVEIEDFYTGLTKTALLCRGCIAHITKGNSYGPTVVTPIIRDIVGGEAGMCQRCDKVIKPSVEVCGHKGCEIQPGHCPGHTDR